MHYSVRAGFALAAISGLLSLWGCAGSGSTLAPSAAGVSTQSVAEHAALQSAVPNILLPELARTLSRAPVVAPRSTAPNAKGAAFVYSCHYYGSDCRIFNARTGAQLAILSSSDGLSDPQGTRTDSSGNWYVANTGDGNVLEFTGDGGTLEATLVDTGWYPVDVAIHASLVAVSNITTVGFTPGTLNIYSGGATKASYVLSDPLAMEGAGTAFDSKGNCYWSFNNESGEGQIDEFPGCTASSVPTNLNIVTGFAGGITFDQHDNLWYVDQYHGAYRCAGLTNCKLVTALGNRMHDALFLNFNSTYKSLYVADAMVGDFYHIDPANGKRTVFEKIGKKDPPFGVATSP
jgi:DNA-binding beta-propeller fold protein YncE